MRFLKVIRSWLTKLNPFRQGFLVAADVRYYFEPVVRDGVPLPSWARLAWLTRKAEQVCLKHWCSEGDIKTAADENTALPFVQAWLHRLDIWPWLGRSISLYCTEVVVAVAYNGEQLAFGRRMSYRLYVDALMDFNEHAKPQLRWTLRSPRVEVAPPPPGDLAPVKGSIRKVGES